MILLPYNFSHRIMFCLRFFSRFNIPAGVSIGNKMQSPGVKGLGRKKKNNEQEYRDTQEDFSLFLHIFNLYTKYVNYPFISGIFLRYRILLLSVWPGKLRPKQNEICSRQDCIPGLFVRI